MPGTHAGHRGIKGHPGKGRCASSPSADSARCDGADAVSSVWDPTHTESPRWTVSTVGGLWIREIALFPPFRSQMGGLFAP